MNIAKILKDAIDSGASDIILTSGIEPSIKLDGEVKKLDGYTVYSAEELEKDLFATMSVHQKQEISSEKELDYSIELKGYSRFRVNVFFTRSGIGAVMRPIRTDIPDFDSLLLPKKLKELTKSRSGLLLITGGVGTGKSTTMAALVGNINKNMKKHIITVEDPIEFVFKNKNSIIEQREVGESTDSFENGLKYALRQASDVIMIGEMRDLETFRLALRAAETGNLVLATLHTSGAARTISRIVDMFPGDEKDYIRAQLASSLLGVIWQDLLKSKDGKGRVLATEFLVNNTSISNMIRKGDMHQIDGAIETGAEDGMYTMEHNLQKLVDNNFIAEKKKTK